MKHILLTGERGAGKSTLIRRLTEDLGCTVCGFLTVRQKEEPDGYHPIYIHSAAQPLEDREHTDANLIGRCNSRDRIIHEAAFDGLGASLIESGRGKLIIMDELGFMERNCAVFSSAILRALDGDIPVLAAVKLGPDTPMLKAVREHPKATLYSVTAENRDALFDELKPILEKMLK